MYSKLCVDFTYKEVAVKAVRFSDQIYETKEQVT